MRRSLSVCASQTVHSHSVRPYAYYTFDKQKGKRKKGKKNTHTLTRIPVRRRRPPRGPHTLTAADQVRPAGRPFPPVRGRFLPPPESRPEEEELWSSCGDCPVFECFKQLLK